jgi:flagellar basal-body rod modification protein FlgD
MDASILSSLGNSPTSSADMLSARELNLGKEDFLKLLVAQLAHQDPLAPMENTEFVSQLAQFSSLEQMMGVNQNLELLQIGQAAMTNSQVAGLIGKQIEAKGDVLQLTQQGPASVNFDLQAPASEVTIKIRNQQGEVVRTLSLGARNPGLNSAEWDGRDGMGNLMPTGTYQVEVSAKDASGADVGVSSRFKGIVTGITYQNGVPLLEVGSSTVRVGDVVAVRIPPSSPSTP